VMPEYEVMLTHKVTLYKRDRNVAGDFEVTQTYPDLRAFVQYGRFLVTNRQNEEILARAIVFLANDAPIDPEWEHWILDQTCPHERLNLEVVRVDSIDNPLAGGATHHYEVAVR